MYAVSPAFHTAMQGDLRRVLARVVIDYTDPLLDQSITISTNDQARVSWPSQTADGLTQVPYLWTVLDGSWTAGGARHPMPDTEAMARLYQAGWWGKTQAGPDGAFAEPYPTLTVSHTPGPVHSLRVVGESILNEYPADFAIRLRDKDGVLLLEETVTGNNRLDWSMTLPAPVLEVATQELEIRSWSQPGTVVKIAEFFTRIQQTYENDGLVFLRLLEEREAGQGSLPGGNVSANEIVVTLSNEDHRFDIDNDTSPLYQLIVANRRVRAWLGAEIGEAVEWVPLGVYWAIDWDTPDDVLEAAVIARDRLELLRTSTYQPGAVLQDATLFDLAEAVLIDAGLSAAEYAIDAALQSVQVPWAWLSPMSHREALRLIAEASLAVVYADREGCIRIETPALSTPGAEVPGTWYIQGAPLPAETAAPDGLYNVGPDDYYPPVRTPSRQDMTANEIIVTTQPLRPAEAASEVYRSSAPIQVPAGQSAAVTVRYQSPPVIDAVVSLDAPAEGLSVTITTEFAWGATVEITNSSAISADATLVVTGKPLSVSGGEQVIARDEASISANGVLRYELPANPLVQTLAQAQAIASSLLAASKDPRRDIELNWRGNPALELGDLVSVLTDAQHDRRGAYSIIRQEIEWAGALSARLTGRRIT